MDELDSRIYYGLKDALRKAIKNIAEGRIAWSNTPIVLIDLHRWEVLYFDDEYEAKDWISKNLNHDDWDEPPNGEDEELILYKFCTEEDKNKFEILYRNYDFLKEVNGEKIYRERSFVEFEPELVINVII